MGDKDVFKDFFNLDDESDTIKNLLSKGSFEEQSDIITKQAREKLSSGLPEEYDNEDDIAKGLLSSLKELIEKEQSDKQEYRGKVTKWLIWYFSLISILVAVLLVLSDFYNPKIIIAIIGGFFTNLIALLLILLKYLYSPSKELHSFVMAIFNRKHSENHIVRGKRR